MDKKVKEMRLLQAQKFMTQLENHGFEVSYFETKEEGLDYLKSVIENGSTIGLGG